ncbi:GNAT family N-acetyltransferase [Leptolyngbya sp. FACHB-671]|uniref:GNAT family N-acetyltransferase n=1 Tax=Leptolyngbya sp. FACHB-671 TaxID=2692812 RepID=UPI001689EB73|nr:GNAT family N-acetyltransferase [Leptolyngbya sp. FACHB-671]MBD2072179.1 GNAT family N-acetyltransferase [Leptolyngbya sp. FACHB-671]
MEVRVREGNEADVEALVLVAARTFALACPANTPQEDIENYIATEFTPEKFKQYINDPNFTIYVAEVAGEAIGYCLLCRSDPPLEELLSEECGNTIELKRLYILPEFHGLGVAQGLMHAALNFAVSNACTQVWLSVSNQNMRAISFYKKSGFIKVGEQKFYVGNDIHDDDIMLNCLI